MRLPRLLLALVAMLPAGASAAEGMKILVLPTIQYAHEDIWSKTPIGRGPAFTAVGQIVRHQPVHILVSATGFATAADGTAEVKYRVTFVRPDGTSGNSQDGLRLIPRGLTHNPSGIHRAADQLVFVLGPDDPLGTWQVRVEASDVVSGETGNWEGSISAEGDELLEDDLPAGVDQGRWLMSYHARPTPHQLFAALKLIAEHPPAGAKPRRDVENGAWLGFFEQVLTDNPWQLPHAIARLEIAEGREQELLATCLAYAKREDRSFYQSLSGRAREAFMRHRVQQWPAPTDEPLNGAQLDVLWGRFFAGGRFAPIRDLTALLAYHRFKDAPAEFKKLDKKPARMPVDVVKGFVFGSLVWSLESNIKQDKVVRDYCEGILLRQELPEADHAWLANIFRSAIEGRQKPAESE